MRLAGRVALITGASRGIGRAIAMELAREGADVAVNYRKQAAAAEETAAEIRALGRRAVIVHAVCLSTDGHRPWVRPGGGAASASSDVAVSPPTSDRGSTMRFGLLCEAQRPFQGTTVDWSTLWRVRTREKLARPPSPNGAPR